MIFSPLAEVGGVSPAEGQVAGGISYGLTETVATRGWPAMPHRNAALTKVPRPLVEALQLALDQVPQSGAQTIAQREIVRALQQALDARRQRIIVSYSTINWVKWSGLALEGILTLLTIGLVHSENRPAAVLAMVIFATAAGASRS
mgnify:CR=1 FL=1